jgi:hypothetical protein
MALNATIGAEDANSYVTAEEATEYFADRIHIDAWTAFVDKESALVTASRLLDWYVKWVGDKVSDVQAMGWPRTGVVLPDGIQVPSDIIPVPIKVAVFELALSSVETDRTADTDMAGLSEIKAGSITLKADDGLYNSSPKVIPHKIWKILYGYSIKSSGMVVRLIRA